MGLGWQLLGRASLLATAAGAVSLAQTWSEGFDDVSLLGDAGWMILNHSSPNPEKSTSVFQGNYHGGMDNPPPVFSAFEGDVNSYAAMNYNSTSSGGTISTWLISPVLTFGEGDAFSFFTRTVSQPQFPDRLEVRISYSGASTNIGLGSEAVGDFDTLLLIVNEGLTTTGYPSDWTLFGGLLENPLGRSGRLAFRYFVPDAGQNGANSDYIGIDSFEFTHSFANGGSQSAEVPEPGTWSAGVFAALLALRALRLARR
jgi:hypothetical protein